MGLDVADGGLFGGESPEELEERRRAVAEYHRKIDEEHAEKRRERAERAAIRSGVRSEGTPGDLLSPGGRAVRRSAPGTPEAKGPTDAS